MSMYALRVVYQGQMHCKCYCQDDDDDDNDDDDDDDDDDDNDDDDDLDLMQTFRSKYQQSCCLYVKERYHITKQRKVSSQF